MDEIQKNNRKKLIKIILVHLEITPTQIAEELNVSVSVFQVIKSIIAVICI